MRKWFWMGLYLVLIVTMTHAQSTCPTLTSERVARLVETCQEAGPGTACVFDDTVQPEGEADLVAPALLRLSGSEEAPLDVLLLGGAQIQQLEIEAPQVTMEARNIRGFNVNLRAGPGTDYEQVGAFRFDARATANGRNADSDWVRIETDQGLVWIGASLVALDGNIEDLPVVAADDIAGVTQGLILSQKTGCEDVLSGLVLTYSGTQRVGVRVNDIPLQFQEAAIWVTLGGDGGLSVAVLSGTVTLQINETVLEAETGMLINTAMPDQTGRYPFALISTLPLNSDSWACIAGITPDSEVNALSQPGAGVEKNTFALSTDSHYPITGQAEDWWRIEGPESSGWVAKSNVETAGNCADIADVNTTNTANTTNTTTSAAPSASPEQVVYGYLQARVNTNSSRMQALSCAAWDGQALIQSQSFRSMNATLEGVGCSTIAQGDDSATVSCSGEIVTVYNGETRTWPLSNYRVVIEGGEWRLCGES